MEAPARAEFTNRLVQVFKEFLSSVRLDSIIGGNPKSGTIIGAEIAVFQKKTMLIAASDRRITTEEKDPQADGTINVYEYEPMKEMEKYLSVGRACIMFCGDCESWAVLKSDFTDKFKFENEPSINDQIDFLKRHASMRAGRLRLIFCAIDYDGSAVRKSIYKRNQGQIDATPDIVVEECDEGKRMYDGSGKSYAEQDEQRQNEEYNRMDFFGESIGAFIEARISLMRENINAAAYNDPQCGIRIDFIVIDEYGNWSPRVYEISTTIEADASGWLGRRAATGKFIETARTANPNN